MADAVEFDETAVWERLVDATSTLSKEVRAVSACGDRTQRDGTDVELATPTPVVAALRTVAAVTALTDLSLGKLLVDFRQG